MGDESLSPRGAKAVRCELEVGKGTGDQFPVDGPDRVDRDCTVAPGGPVEYSAKADDCGIVYHFSDCSVYVVRPGAEVCRVLQQLSTGARSERRDFQVYG